MGREHEILAAAAKAFHEKGFHGVGMDELGRRAGLSGPALYRSFSGKDEILATLLNEAMDELMSAVIAVHEDPQLDLDRALTHHVRFSVRHSELVNLYQREVRSLAEPWNKQFNRRRRQYTERWEELFRRRYPTLGGDAVSVAVQSTLGTIFSLPYWPGRALQVADVEDLLLSYLRGALRAVEEGAPTAPTL